MRICIDIDEVMCPMVRPLLSHNGRHCGHIRRYRYAPLLGVSEAKSRELVRDYYNSEAFMGAQPFPGVPEALRMASDSGKVTLVSSRQWYARVPTERWLERYGLQQYAEDLVLCNSFSEEGEEVSKTDMVRCLGGDVLFDDSSSTLGEVLGLGFQGWLCTQRGLNTWTEGSDLPVCHDLLDGVNKYLTGI